MYGTVIDAEQYLYLQRQVPVLRSQRGSQLLQLRLDPL